MHVSIVRRAAGPLLCAGAEGVFGGAEVRAVTFAQCLARDARFTVRFVVDPGCTTPPLLTRQPSSLHAQIEVCPLSVYRFRGPFADGQGMARVLAQRLVETVRKRISRQPPRWQQLASVQADWFLVFGIHDPAASVIRWAAEHGRRSALFLTSQHDVSSAFGPRGNQKARQQRIHRNAIRRADIVIAQTIQQQRQLRELAQRDAVLLRNPIDTSLTTGAPAALNQRRHALWVGRADNDCKRADLMLDLARQCPQVPFRLIMNDLQDGQFTRLMAHAPPNVEVLERVGWTDVERHFADARVLVNTSDSEGFPNAFLQAGKFGVPIVSLNVDPDKVLTQHQIGFVANGHLPRAAAMVQRIWNRPEQFQWVSQAGRRYVVNHHDVGPVVEQLKQLLGQARVGEQREAA